MGEKSVPVERGAEAFVELLGALGVDTIFLNPGSDTIPIQNALSKFRASGKPSPEIVLCLHETVGMAAAHGYFMVSGKPQVVLVHVDIGLQQIGGALHNAQRGRAAIVLCSGMSPAIQGEGRGGRTHPINWLQDQFDQAGLVRGYVKWQYNLRYSGQIQDVMQRAFQMALTEPWGPVYVSLSREVLLEKMEEITIPTMDRYGAPRTPQADTQSLEDAADILSKAENPLIITGYSGRHPESVPSLVKLAETLGARVLSAEVRMNFPSTHPLCAGIDPMSGPGDTSHLKSEADVILIVDHDVPYIPVRDKLRPDARIIHMDIDPVKERIPLWTFPADILMEADSRKAIPLLNELILQKINPDQRVRIRGRSEQLEKEHRKMREEWHRLATGQSNQKPISPEWLCHCISEVMDEDTLLLTDVVSDSMSVARQIDRTKPGTLFSHGGSSLGWGMGAALGAKLAAPDKIVVNLTGDGGFVFGCPIASLWASSHYHAPFLSVIFNNQSYNTIKRILRIRHGRNSSSESGDSPIGVDIRPSPDYALVARACYAYGRTVAEPADLLPALKEALDEVRRGKPAVLDVRVGET